MCRFRGKYVWRVEQTPLPSYGEARIVIVSFHESLIPMSPWYRFLSELASHRYFSEHHVIKNYLISTDLAAVIKEREKLGSGTMWSQLTKVYSDYQLGKIQVC